MYDQFVEKHIHIPVYENLQCESLGMDSIEHCLDKKWFAKHAPVKYHFNEIGFRTHSVELFQTNAVLVFGDSFTLGLGSNTQDRYTDILEQNLSHQVLNFSLNGASNDWIARKLIQILPMFRPRAIVVHYTFSHRRERPQTDWHDNERTECEPWYTDQQNYDNWRQNYEQICATANTVPVVHSFIKNWHNHPVDYSSLGPRTLRPVDQIDHARDGFHYGVNTHRNLATAITSLLVDV